MMVPWAAGPTVRAREEQGTDAGPHLGEARSLLLPLSIIQLSLRPPDTLAGLTLPRPSMPSLLLQGPAVLGAITMGSWLQGPPL